MATTYKSTLEVNVWKEHSCIGCGSRFRYLFKRKKTGQGNSPDAASKAARKAVLSALENEVDMHPCPGCGLYQPDMVGSQRSTRHWWLIAATLVFLILVLILVLTDVMTTATTAWSALAVCAVLALGHLLIDRNNPNRNLERNHELASRKRERGDLWTPPGSPARAEPSDPPRFGWSSTHTVAYVLLALGLLALISPEVLRGVHGWPANPDWYPLAAGPGDEVYTYFPDKINSVKGYWSGNATATIVNAAEAGLNAPRLSATSQMDKWGDTIRIGSKESKTSTKTLWVRVVLPPDARLEGKPLQIRMTLDVTYPELRGNNWDETRGHYEATRSIQLGGAGAGSRYKTWWWGGFLGGSVLVLVSSFLLVRLSSGMRKLAQPTTIFDPGEGEDDVPEAAEDIPEVLPADKPRRDDDEGIVRRG